MSSRPIIVLSQRRCFFGGAQGCVIELEEVFASLTGATVLCPSNSAELARLLEALPAASTDLFFATISITGPVDLLKGIRGWRRPFCRVYGYVFDAWLLGRPAPPSRLKQHFRSQFSRFHQVVRGIDHIFVSNEHAVATFSDAYQVPVSHVAMAADVVRFGSSRGVRPISVNAYGRQHGPHVDALAAAFNTTESKRFLHHTNHMVGHVVNAQQHRAHFWKLLGLSAISLAYDAQRVDPDRRGFPAPFVGQRWYEGWCAGCVVVGWRPRCAEADAVMTWPDATLEAPESPAELLEFIDALLEDETRLAQVRIRNVAEMATAHDWGYRVIQMFAELGEETPSAWPQRAQCLESIRVATIGTDPPDHARAHGRQMLP